MTIGIVFAINRLKKRDIYCISPSRVNVCGRVNLFVFDKTGTLTEEGLEVYGFRGVEEAEIKGRKHQFFGKFQEDPRRFQPQRVWWNLESDYNWLKHDPKTLFLEGLASCHTITYVDNVLIGDPLDVKMFQSTQWIMEEPLLESKVDEIVLAYVKPPFSPPPPE